MSPDQKTSVIHLHHTALGLSTESDHQHDEPQHNNHDMNLNPSWFYSPSSLKSELGVCQMNC